VTNKIKNALEAISVKVIDHIIIAGERYFSFLEQKMI
jgi:DNA repair protein RadC